MPENCTTSVLSVCTGTCNKSIVTIRCSVFSCLHASMRAFFKIVKATKYCAYAVKTYGASTRPRSTRRNNYYNIRRVSDEWWGLKYGLYLNGDHRWNTGKLTRHAHRLSAYHIFWPIVHSSWFAGESSYGALIGLLRPRRESRCRGIFSRSPTMKQDKRERGCVSSD